VTENFSRHAALFDGESARISLFARATPLLLTR
jgi:hypothetical protein